MDENLNNSNLIIRCLGNIATEAEKQELFSWISQNKTNETLYFSLKDLYDAGNWDKLKQEANTSQLWEQLNSKIRESPINLNQRPKWYLEILKYAAVFIIGILSVLIVQPDKSKPDIISKNEVITGIGERTQLVLPDSTKVWVNSCSSVTYNSDFDNKSRDIYLEGEAFFKVTKNKKLPFIVHTSGFKVKALGTSFNVSAYEDDNELFAVLLEGSISFENSKLKEPAIIKPGEKISYSKSNNQIQINEVNPELYAAWSSGETRFEHLKLAEITKRLQRAYNVKIILNNEKIKNMYFTGTFQNYESLDQILKVICTNTRLTFKSVKDTIYLK